MKHHQRSPRAALAVVALLVGSVGLGCSDPTGMANHAGQVNTPADFEVAWSAVDSFYPFFEFKGIDWAAVYAAYRPPAERAKGYDGYVTLLKMLGELRDGHVWLRPAGGETIPLKDGWVSGNDGKIWSYYPPRKARDRDVWSPSLLLEYLDPASVRLSEDSLVGWASVDGDADYMYVSGFMPHEIMGSLRAALDGVRSSRALIVDVRHNEGGHGDVIREFVGRFLTEPLAGLVFYMFGERHQWQPIQPGGPFQYTNPVVVLINGYSFSGAEAFAEMMKQLPHATVVGDTTGGGSGGVDNSAPGIVQLPSGTTIGFPTVDLRRYDGLPWEWLGIPPDIRVEQTAADFANGRDKQLEFAIEFLKRSSATTARIVMSETY